MRSLKLMQKTLKKCMHKLPILEWQMYSKCQYEWFQNDTCLLSVNHIY